MPPHDVHVWYHATGALDAAAIGASVAILSDDERAQYQRFRSPDDARDYAAAHALLRVALSRESGRAPAEWRFDRTPDGKPFAIEPGLPRVSFSLSHARGMVACAVTAGTDVGVDVESLDRDVDVPRITARFFAPVEAADLARLSSAQRLDRFFDLWTLKEALAKASGAGIAESVASLAFTIGQDGAISVEAPSLRTDSWQFALFAPGPRHRLAVAVCRPRAQPAHLIFGDAALLRQTLG